MGKMKTPNPPIKYRCDQNIRRMLSFPLENSIEISMCTKYSSTGTYIISNIIYTYLLSICIHILCKIYLPTLVFLSFGYIDTIAFYIRVLNN